MSVTSDTTDTSVISVTSIGDDLIYDATTVSKILGVQESTLRKYCLLMQKYNFEFNKNSVGHRIFYKKDIEVIKRIIDLKNASSLTLDQAVKSILDCDINDIDDITDITDITSISDTDLSKILDEFKEYKKEQMQFNKEQMEFNKKLIEQLEKQDHYIKNKLEERDKKLMLALKESMESRKEMAAAIEEVKEERNKRKLWWKFWQ